MMEKWENGKIGGMKITGGPCWDDEIVVCVKLED
jgi:hypothetical protein